MKNTTKKAQKEIRNTLEKFAKRSKYISIVRHSTFYGFQNIQIKCEKETKIYKELLTYLISLCKYVEMEKNSKFIWFHNYDICKDDECEEWEHQIQICLSVNK